MRRILLALTMATLATAAAPAVEAEHPPCAEDYPGCNGEHPVTDILCHPTVVAASKKFLRISLCPQDPM